MAETRNKSIVKAISNALVLGEIDTAGNIAGGDLDSDTTPQLGGNLDINGNDIISLAGGNIDILPHSSGKINLDGDGSASGISVTDGLIEMRTSTGSVAAIDMYCEVSNAHKVTIKPPPHADYSGNVTFQLPPNNGTSGQVLKTDGNGVTTWGSAANTTPFQYTATANQTSFTGSDDNGNTLSYTAGKLLVYQNGILLTPVLDYTASSGNSVVLITGAELNDIIIIAAFVETSQTTITNVTTNVLYEHANSINSAYSITSGNNAMSAGPITVESGGSVTVPTGSSWVVV
jgi:hypothetical protein